MIGLKTTWLTGGRFFAREPSNWITYLAKGFIHLVIRIVYSRSGFSCCSLHCFVIPVIYWARMLSFVKPRPPPLLPLEQALLSLTSLVYLSFVFAFLASGLFVSFPPIRLLVPFSGCQWRRPATSLALYTLNRYSFLRLHVPSPFTWPSFWFLVVMMW